MRSGRWRRTHGEAPNQKNGRQFRRARCLAAHERPDARQEARFGGILSGCATRQVSRDGRPIDRNQVDDQAQAGAPDMARRSDRLPLEVVKRSGPRGAIACKPHIERKRIAVRRGTVGYSGVPPRNAVCRSRCIFNVARATAALRRHAQHCGCEGSQQRLEPGRRKRKRPVMLPAQKRETACLPALPTRHPCCRHGHIFLLLPPNLHPTAEASAPPRINAAPKR